MQQVRKTKAQTAVDRAQAGSLFEGCMNTKKQGDIGEARAIYEYTKLGHVVCAPLCDSAKYDLIVEKDGIMKRVQVKTSSYIRNGGFVIIVATTGGNSSRNYVVPRKEGDFDDLFILTSNDRCWMIPEKSLGKKQYSVSVGGVKWQEFELL